MKVVMCISADRGLRCLETLRGFSVNEIVVFTFNETSWEPPFVEAIKRLADDLDARLFVSSKLDMYLDELAGADLMLLVGWRYMVRKEVFQIPTKGCFVIHDSILPRWRGFSPTIWAIRNGDSEVGVSLFKISQGMDEGPIVDQLKLDLNGSEYIEEVMADLTTGCVKLVRDLIARIDRGEVIAGVPQNQAMATYGCKLLPCDFRLDFKRGAEWNARMVRSYSKPYPGAFCYLNAESLTIWTATVELLSECYAGFVPGRIKSINSDGSITVFCGDRRLGLRVEQVSFGRDRQPVMASEVISEIGVTLE